MSLPPLVCLVWQYMKSILFRTLQVRPCTLIYSNIVRRYLKAFLRARYNHLVHFSFFYRHTYSPIYSSIMSLAYVLKIRRWWVRSRHLNFGSPPLYRYIQQHRCAPVGGGASTTLAALCGLPYHVLCGFMWSSYVELTSHYISIFNIRYNDTP